MLLLFLLSPPLYRVLAVCLVETLPFEMDCRGSNELPDIRAPAPGAGGNFPAPEGAVEFKCMAAAGTLKVVRWHTW